MRNYSLTIILIIPFLMLIQQGCASLFQNEKLLRQEIVRNNKIYLDSLTYGISPSKVNSVVNSKLPYDARIINPRYIFRLKGKANFNFTVYFYEYSDTISTTNILFRDERYVPVIFNDEFLVGKSWDDYENLIGPVFVMGDKGLAGKGENISPDTVSIDTLNFGIGTGFLVNNDGYIVTNCHVVDEVDSVSIYSPLLDKKFEVVGVVKDKEHDIAILKISDSTFNKTLFPVIDYRIAGQQEVKMGEEVFTLGFPLTNFLGTTTRLSNGLITSKYGINDEPDHYQVSNPVQPGNSGGPIFNMKGNLVGIAVSTLNTPLVLLLTGVTTQNISFAIKADYLETLLDTSGIEKPISVAEPEEDLKMVTLVEKLNPFVVMIVSEDPALIDIQQRMMKKMKEEE